MTSELLQLEANDGQRQSALPPVSGLGFGDALRIARGCHAGALEEAADCSLGNAKHLLTNQRDDLQYWHGQRAVQADSGAGV
jgi:hypothetical protein